MSHRILLQPGAAEEIDEIIGYIASDSPTNAARWFDGLMEEIYSLYQLPRRHPVAPENRHFAEEIRQFMYGRYRILYTVDEHFVRILHVRHGARRPLSGPVRCRKEGGQ